MPARQIKAIKAASQIEGNSVVVWNDSLAKPAAVRYCWWDAPSETPIYNKAGLPAGSFRTDNWKLTCETEGTKGGESVFTQLSKCRYLGKVADIFSSG